MHVLPLPNHEDQHHGLAWKHLRHDGQRERRELLHRHGLLWCRLDHVAQGDVPARRRRAGSARRAPYLLLLGCLIADRTTPSFGLIPDSTCVRSPDSTRHLKKERPRKQHHGSWAVGSGADFLSAVSATNPNVQFIRALRCRWVTGRTPNAGTARPHSTRVDTTIYGLAQKFSDKIIEIRESFTLRSLNVFLALPYPFRFRSLTPHTSYTSPPARAPGGPGASGKGKAPEKLA